MIGPEKILLAILLALLATSLALLLFADIDPELTRRLAIGVCLALAGILGIGVIFPVRRYLRRRDEAEGDGGGR